MKIHRGNLDLPDNTSSNFYVSIKVDNLKAQSVERSGKQPAWEQEFCFELPSNKIGDKMVTLEVWEKGFLWDKILGTACIPFEEISASSEETPLADPTCGPKWLQMYEELLPTAVGSSKVRGHRLTCHELLVESRWVKSTILAWNVSIMH